MKLSVIIACYNAEKTLGEQLDALCSQKWDLPWEVILVNNRCTDNSIQIAKTYQQKLQNFRILDALERQGQPYALNAGIMAAKGESFILCDADDVAGKDYVKILGSALQVHDFVASSIDMKKLNPFWGHLKDFSHQNTELPKLRFYPYVCHGGGCSLGFTRNVVDRIGFFSEDFPYLHDTDFCIRAQLAGYNLKFVPEAVTHYRLRDSYKGIFKQRKGWNSYRVLLAKKYKTSNRNMWFLHMLKHLAGVPGIILGISKAKSKEDKILSVINVATFYGTFLGTVKYRYSPH